MTNFERYKKDLRMIDAIEDIIRYKCSIEPHHCPAKDLRNENADYRRLLRAYFEQEVGE